MGFLFKYITYVGNMPQKQEKGSVTLTTNLYVGWFIVHCLFSVVIVVHMGRVLVTMVARVVTMVTRRILVLLWRVGIREKVCEGYLLFIFCLLALCPALGGR